MNKQGALLLEVMLASAITSLLMVGLMASIYQLNKAQASMDRRIEAYTRASLIFHQLEHDVTGVFLPIQNKIAAQKKEPNSAKPATPLTPSTPAAPSAQPTNEKTGEKKKEVKVIPDIFIGTNEGENSAMISCVTTNPVSVFWSENAGKPKPRAARVIYRLQKDAQKEPVSFTLMRQEGEDLYLKTYEAQENKARSYELASGIKMMRLEYMVPKKVEKKEPSNSEKQTPENNNKPLEYETKPDWKVKEIKPEEEQKSTTQKPANPDQKQEKKEPEEPVLIPQYIRIVLELWDSAYKRSQEFTYTISLVVSTQRDKKQKAPAPKPQQAPDSKPGATPPKTAYNSPPTRRRPLQHGARFAGTTSRPRRMHV